MSARPTCASCRWWAIGAAPDGVLLRVPEGWTAYARPCMRPIPAWFGLTMKPWGQDVSSGSGCGEHQKGDDA